MSLDLLDELTTRLSERAGEISIYDDYYRGRHQMMFATSDFREAFGRVLDGYADNWTKIVIDACVERLTPVGFRYGDRDAEADGDAWGMWQANRLDSRIQTAFTESLISGVSYLAVWFPDGAEMADDGSVFVPPGRWPRITVEHPAQMIVRHADGDPDTRVAAAKVWGEQGQRHAVLFLPDVVHRFTERSSGDGQRGIQWDEVGVFPNPLGVVPVVPLTNRPRLLNAEDGESELSEILPNQNAINKLIKDMLVASEYGSFPQRWATGVEIPHDPETNEPIESWTPDVSRFLTTASPDAKLGSLAAADLSGFVVALENRVNAMASQSRTPPHYLNSSADRLSGESMKAAEAGLVARSREKILYLSDPIEETIQLGFRALGDPRGESRPESLWRDPESHNLSVLTDSVIKQLQAGLIPWQVAAEQMGYSPAEIDRMRDMRQREALEFGLGVDLADEADLAEPV